jgi:DNA-binding beta-propeller fold protein YncE
VVFDRTDRRIGGLGQPHQPNMPFNHPCDVAIAPSGNIYVADGYGASRVNRFGSNGDLIATWGTPGTGPAQFSTPHGIWAAGGWAGRGDGSGEQPGAGVLGGR